MVQHEKKVEEKKNENNKSREISFREKDATIVAQMRRNLNEYDVVIRTKQKRPFEILIIIVFV